jgi:hypothetical protein
MWSHTDNGTVAGNMTVTGVPAHGVIAVLLKDAGNITDAATSAKFSGGATTTTVSPSPSPSTAQPSGSDQAGKNNGDSDYRLGPIACMAYVLVAFGIGGFA